MRYKSMPMTVRSGTPSFGDDPRLQTPNSKPRPWWFDWLLTIPVILLVPAILVPYLVLGGSPWLSVSDPVIAGHEIVIRGQQFAPHKRLQLQWDGSVVAWLSSPKTDRKGAFTVSAALPAETAPGEHQLSAAVRGSGQSARSGPQVVASVAIVVVDDVTALPQTASPTAAGLTTPTPAPAPTPTLAPTAAPTATAVPTSTPAVTAAPTPTPSPSNPVATAPPAPSGKVGYGAGVTGGNKVVEVSSLAQLRSAIQRGNYVILRGSGTWDLAGTDLDIDVPDFTLDNQQAGIVFKGGAIRIQPPAGNVLLRYVKSRAGDQSGNPADLDAITVNAQSGRIRGLYFDHVEAWWGPDVTFALLGDIQDVTLDGVIVAGGLVRSAHPEANEDIDGHSMGLNLTALSGQAIGPQRVTIYRSLIALNETRNPQLRMAGPVDIVDCVIFGADRAPYGNALGGLNIIGTVYRHGEAATAAFGSDAKNQTEPFRAVNKDGYLTPNSVYVDPSTRAADFTFSAVDPAIRASSPMVAPSVRSAGGDTESIVLSYVGSRRPYVDAITQSLLDAVRSGGGRYYNGAGYPEPNPTWQ